MLKKTLIKCSQLIGRDDIILTLKDVNDADEIENSSIKNDVTRLINFYNFIVNSICENYLDLTYTESLSSDFERKIFYHDFYYYPIKIIEIADKNFGHRPFQIKSNFIITNEPNKIYNITYKYVPNAITKLSDCSSLTKTINDNIICFGIASEFLASKGQYNQSEYWKNKFLFEIFKIKTHKERLLKSTFCKWNRTTKTTYFLTLIQLLKIR